MSELPCSEEGAFFMVGDWARHSKFLVSNPVIVAVL